MFRPSFNPARYHIWKDDFDDYAATDWIITTVEAGSGDAAEVSTSERGGVLQITNDNADNDLDFFQYAGVDSAAVRETWKFVAGKRLYFETRFKLSDATLVAFVAGLQITDTSPLTVTDGIYLKKDGSDAFLDFHVVKNSTATDKTAIHTMVADTWVVAAFYYLGGNVIRSYVNGLAVGSSVITNVPDDEELTISFGIQNAEAAAKVLSVDYIFVASERDSP